MAQRPEDEAAEHVADLERLHSVMRFVGEGISTAGTVTQALALGHVRAGTEIVAGVISELRADPPRALNALRLARHLWEMECDLHYVAEFPRDAIRQVWASEAFRKVEVARGILDWKSVKEQDRWKADRALICEARKRDKALADQEVQAAQASDATTSAGAGATQGGFLPSRRQMLKALGRAEEMTAYYNAASWLSHPSLQAMSNHLTVAADGTIGPAIPAAVRLPAVAASMARVSASRLTARANWILGPLPRIGAELQEWMEARGIGMTGLVAEDL